MERFRRLGKLVVPPLILATGALSQSSNPDIYENPEHLLNNSSSTVTSNIIHNFEINEIQPIMHSEQLGPAEPVNKANPKFQPISFAINTLGIERTDVEKATVNETTNQWNTQDYGVVGTETTRGRMILWGHSRWHGDFQLMSNLTRLRPGDEIEINFRIDVDGKNFEINRIANVKKLIIVDETTLNEKIFWDSNPTNGVGFFFVTSFKIRGENSPEIIPARLNPYTEVEENLNPAEYQYFVVAAE